jgi:hypothetical protein
MDHYRTESSFSQFREAGSPAKDKKESSPLEISKVRENIYDRERRKRNHDIDDGGAPELVLGQTKKSNIL